MPECGKQCATYNYACTTPGQQFFQWYIESYANADTYWRPNSHGADKAKADDAIFIPYAVDDACMWFCCFGFSETGKVFFNFLAEKCSNIYADKPTCYTRQKNDPWRKIECKTGRYGGIYFKCSKSISRPGSASTARGLFVVYTAVLRGNRRTSAIKAINTSMWRATE